MDSNKRPDLIDATFCGVLTGEDWITDEVPEEKFADKLNLCSNMTNKYYITLDGNNSTYLRSQTILASDSVPIVIESNFRPIYLDVWEPWVHYVPVKNNQSDLFEKIEWLQSHDAEAKQIALAGRALFNKLYNLGNMIEDMNSVFVKYASLMTYEPERPDIKHKWNDRKMTHW